MTNSFKTLTYDVLVIGSGAAGLGVALSLAEKARVAIISKDDLQAGSSQHAQGGIAAAIGVGDSIAAHIQDTLNAGVGLCDAAIVEFTATHAKSAIDWLIDHGVQFTTQQNSNHLHLTQEGGHSHRRILHAADKTGAVVVKTLSEQVNEHPHIDCLTEHTAIDLILDQQQCVGAYVYDEKNHRCISVHAKFTVLATGGASYLYQHTSNPDRTTGDGIAMAWRAGCRVANLEFNQFHPTCLYHPQAPRFLITEVVRGEGGHLVLPNGERFMPRYDKRAELAPRDVVTRAIDIEMKNNQLDCVYLDISHRPADFIKNTFPTIYAQCLQYGIDITKERIPVVPAAHYTCGGIMTNKQGQTDIANLYAVGEVAHTGLHGANRMASNSLLECLVFAASAAQAIIADLPSISLTTQSFHYPQAGNENNLNIAGLTATIRRILWHHAGIVRHNRGLKEAKYQLNMLSQKINTAFSQQQISKPLLELRNMILVAKLIVDSALLRKESRGLHYNNDYPNVNATAINTILIPEKIPLQLQQSF
jgi:L-aspartate oxidase